MTKLLDTTMHRKLQQSLVDHTLLVFRHTYLQMGIHAEITAVELSDSVLLVLSYSPVEWQIIALSYLLITACSNFNLILNHAGF